MAVRRRRGRHPRKREPPHPRGAQVGRSPGDATRRRDGSGPGRGATRSRMRRVPTASCAAMRRRRPSPSTTPRGGAGRRGRPRRASRTRASCAPPRSRCERARCRSRWRPPTAPSTTRPGRAPRAGARAADRGQRRGGWSVRWSWPWCRVPDPWSRKHEIAPPMLRASVHHSPQRHPRHLARSPLEHRDATPCSQARPGAFFVNRRAARETGVAWRARRRDSTRGVRTRRSPAQPSSARRGSPAPARETGEVGGRRSIRFRARSGP